MTGADDACWLAQTTVFRRVNTLFSLLSFPSAGPSAVLEAVFAELCLDKAEALPLCSATESSCGATVALLFFELFLAPLYVPCLPRMSSTVLWP